MSLAPITERDVKIVTRNIEQIFKNKEEMAFALASSYAVTILSTFRSNQAGGMYWNNKTFNAYNEVFSDAFKDSEGVGFFISHGVTYGKYLEFANNRDHAALVPLTNEIAPRFLEDLRKLYGKG